MASRGRTIHVERSRPAHVALIALGLVFILAAPVAAAPDPARGGDDAVTTLLADLQARAPRLDAKVLRLALEAARCAGASDGDVRRDILTVIDYSLPSTQERLWVFDLATRRLLFRQLVAHGKNTGGNRARRFSNVVGSKQSSLGLFRTAGTYEGANGYSLRLHGLEPRFNDRALARAIVVHGAWYVSDDFARAHGRLGRSWGCPALDPAVAREIIDVIKDGSLLFAYYPDQKWLTRSAYLGGTCRERPASDGGLVAAR